MANGITSTFGLGTDITLRQIQNGTVYATKAGTAGVKILGKSVSGAGVLLTFVEIAQKDQIKGSDLAHGAASLMFAAVAIVPGVGPVISFGLTTADAVGAFDSFYQAFDTYNSVDPTIGWKIGHPGIISPGTKINYKLGN